MPFVPPRPQPICGQKVHRARAGLGEASLGVPLACHRSANLSSTDTGGEHSTFLVSITQFCWYWRNSRIFNLSLGLMEIPLSSIFSFGLWEWHKPGLRSRQKLRRRKKEKYLREKGRKGEGWETGRGSKFRSHWEETGMICHGLACKVRLAISEIWIYTYFIRHEVAGEEARVRPLELISQFPENSLSAIELIAQETKLPPHTLNFRPLFSSPLCLRRYWSVGLAFTTFSVFLKKLYFHDIC